MSVSVVDPTFAHLETLTRPTPCTEELSQINESLRRREALLVASAKASRMLLEAPDVRGTIPGVLRLIGEAAHVDRVNVMRARRGPEGEPLLVVVSEWTAEGVPPHIDDPAVCMCDERQFSAVSAELRAGRSVCLNKSESPVNCAAVTGFEGIGTKTKAIVPIFVAGEFIGVVGFDNTRQRRAIDSSELAALENAAGVIGAALHRQRLIDDMRRERERAAEERVAELAKANAVIRGNLERLASEPDLHSFLGHVLLEATRQFDAASGAVVVSKDSLQQWRIAAHVRDGRIEEPPYPISVPIDGSSFGDRFTKPTEPMYLDVEQQSEEFWPGMLAFHRQEGYAGTVVYPLVFGSRNVGFLILRFRRIAHDVQRSELLVALAQQATLAVQLTRLAYQAKEAAVLVERARIGQEIHDGLAQAFTGILMQLGAVEEFPSCKKKNSGLALTLTRIRDLAREGLAEARRSVMALRLDQTRRAGLELALRQLAERSTVPGGVTCSFEGGGITTGLKPEYEHELLRIAQEAVSNAVRHARPHAIRITMTDETAHWEMAVEDDGRGMEQRPEWYAREGFGLTSMRQRASAIGGEWQIESQPGAGTRVSVRLPKRKAAA
ncbi:MAG TPA: GAF domain-containing sensor histidine kinase [Steroidobacteraceae bacterium]|nr:GAF domain-containing sensor histidine kinase [Steroidobacteraceae bacterium]